MYHKQIVDDYCEDVLDGTIPTGRLVRLAVRRHVADLKHGAERGLYFDERKATEACRFFPECLRHSKGEWAGKPFILTPSQAFIAWNVFGWQRASGVRRFSRAHIEVARKGGKSEFASGVALRHGSCDDPFEPGAEVYLCATKEDQVRDTTFKQCTRMVKQSPSLRQRIKCQVKSLVISEVDAYQPNSVIKPIGSDSNTSDGFDLHAGILDELHAYARHHHGFYERMTTAGGSRRQEMVWFFTTAGDDKSELWISLREHVVRVLESVETGEIVSDHVFGFIACVDETDDPLSLDPESDEFIKVMRKANPNFPITPKLPYLQDQANSARGNPLESNKFMRFHANSRVSSSIKAFPTAEWQKHSEDVLPGPKTQAIGAFDLGRSDDFAAWAIVWRDGENIRFVTRSYTCSERPKHLRTVEIQNWVRHGFLVEHPGSQLDFLSIENDIIAAHEEYGATSWAFDEHFAKIVAQNIGRQIGESLMVKFIQGHRFYNEPCRLFLKEFKAGNIRPETNPCTRWQARNVSFSPNSRDEWMPDKGLGHEYKIDAMVAVLMAYGVMVTEPVAGPSVYEERGLLVF